MQPLYDLLESLRLRWQNEVDTYNQFIAEETKEKWAWSKRYQKELNFWAAIPGYILGKYQSPSPWRWLQARSYAVSKIDNAINFEDILFRLKLGFS